MPEQIRFSLIDDTNREDHTRLTPDDRCYHLFEYTSRKNYAFSDTNNLIWNLKKKPSQRGTAAYRYKGVAIKQCSVQMRQALSSDWLKSAVLVPVPSSKAIDHPDYDDRMEKICRGIGADVDVRTLVRQITSMDAAHEATDRPRPTVEDLLANYVIDDAQVSLGEPVSIGIVDDVLTAGTHFKAMQRVLSDRFPASEIYGLFVARRIFPPEDNSFAGSY